MSKSHGQIAYETLCRWHHEHNPDLPPGKDWVAGGFFLQWSDLPEKDRAMWEAIGRAVAADAMGAYISANASAPTVERLRRELVENYAEIERLQRSCDTLRALNKPGSTTLDDLRAQRDSLQAEVEAVKKSRDLACEVSDQVQQELAAALWSLAQADAPRDEPRRTTAAPVRGAYAVTPREGWTRCPMADDHTAKCLCMGGYDEHLTRYGGP